MSPRAAQVAAQAKVNLFLRVLAREASGYHQLETLFQRLDLADDVRVAVGGAGRVLDCRGADVGPVERNLAWRAAVAYADATGWPAGFAIEVDKRIPVGGGLGGGSADAGAVLRCLDALAPRPVGPAALLAIAAPLGADVPFLAAETPLALAWGRGERLLALPALPERAVALMCFDDGVPTAGAYGWLAEARAADPARALPEPRLLAIERLADWRAIAALAGNDFEAPVAARHRGVAVGLRAFGEIADGMRRWGDAGAFALMSGSGATLFLAHDPDAHGGAWDGGAPAGARIVTTRTSGRVAPVELSG